MNSWMNIECHNPFSPCKAEEEAQSLKLALGQPWVWSVRDLIFLASAYEGGWPVLSLTVSSSHWQCTVSVLIIDELARGADGTEISNQISALAGFEHANH